LELRQLHVASIGHCTTTRTFTQRCFFILKVAFLGRFASIVQWL
jgi:hypothetical protein